MKTSDHHVDEAIRIANHLSGSTLVESKFICSRAETHALISIALSLIEIAKNSSLKK